MKTSSIRYSEKLKQIKTKYWRIYLAKNVIEKEILNAIDSEKQVDTTNHITTDIKLNRDNKERKTTISIKINNIS